MLVYRNPRTSSAEDYLLHTLEEIMYGKCLSVSSLTTLTCHTSIKAKKTAVDPGNRLVDFDAQYNLMQRVLQPTREDHVLDLVLCTEARLIQGNVDLCDKESSDHRTVSFEINAGSKYSQELVFFYKISKRII